MTYRAAALAAAAAALALSASTAADTVSVRDEADARAAPLDIASVGHGHDARGRLVHRVTMQAAWRLEALRPGRGELTIPFDLDGKFVDGHPSVERAVFIAFRSGRLRAVMRGGPGLERVVGRVPVWRPNNRTVKVAVPTALLGRRLTAYYWFASTLVYSGEHIRGGDAAPGPTASIPTTIEHSLRGRLAG